MYSCFLVTSGYRVQNKVYPAIPITPCHDSVNVPTCRYAIVIFPDQLWTDVNRIWMNWWCELICKLWCLTIYKLFYFFYEWCNIWVVQAYLLNNYIVSNSINKLLKGIYMWCTWKYILFIIVLMIGYAVYFD